MTRPCRSSPALRSRRPHDRVAGARWSAAVMRGALEIAARLRRRPTDPCATPSPEAIHEMARGPLADLRSSAKSRTTALRRRAALFLLTLTELWHWTGDTEVLRRHGSTARASPRWAERYGDLDGDGLLEYQQRSPVGIKNQGWKAPTRRSAIRRRRRSETRSRLSRSRPSTTSRSSGWPRSASRSRTTRLRTRYLGARPSLRRTGTPRSGCRTKASTRWPSIRTSPGPLDRLRCGMRWGRQSPAGACRAVADRLFAGEPV